MKELHFKERCQVRACSSAVLLHAVVFFPPLYSHKHTHTNTHTQYKKGRAEILFARHNFVWQRWQIVFYDWTGFSGLFGTHPPTMQWATVTALPATLAQRRCLMWGSTLNNLFFLFNISVSGGRTKDRRREQRQSRRKRKSSRACHLFTGLYLSGDYNVMGLSIPPAGLPVMLHALIYSQWIVGMCLPGKAILVGT